MTEEPVLNVVLCNGANEPDYGSSVQVKKVRLDYEQTTPGMPPNIKVSLMRFMEDVNHLPLRLRDLLEIASFVFCADRAVPRGSKNALEYHRWPRKFHFAIKVRDLSFWSLPSVTMALSAALTFMSGDETYSFSFQGGRSEPVNGLFDDEVFLIEPNHPATVALFSGGLDSTAGVVKELSDPDKVVYAVSHRSNQPSTSRTQDTIIRKLKEIYGENRLRRFKFSCSFTGIRAPEESQRTRAFLYASIAFALSRVLLKDSFMVFENGVTAVNIPKREDMWSARASRTAHPKTLHLLSRLFSLVAGSEFLIASPFLWLTKPDVFTLLRDCGRSDFIPLTVSCSRTFKSDVGYTHCGVCTQCVERRLAAYSSRLVDYDHAGLYTIDFVRTTLSGESRTIAADYIRSASRFAAQSIDQFYVEHVNELADICDNLDLAGC